MFTGAGDKPVTTSTKGPVTETRRKRGAHDPDLLGGGSAGLTARTRRSHEQPAERATHVSESIPSSREPLVVQEIPAVGASRHASEGDGAHAQQGDGQHLRVHNNNNNSSREDSEVSLEDSVSADSSSVGAGRSKTAANSGATLTQEPLFRLCAPLPFSATRNSSVRAPSLSLSLYPSSLTSPFRAPSPPPSSLSPSPPLSCSLSHSLPLSLPLSLPPSLHRLCVRSGKRERDSYSGTALCLGGEESSRLRGLLRNRCR